MKKQLSKLRRFFSRTGSKKLDATATREAIPVSYDDDDGSTRLSGAFIIVLLLHVVALVGVFAYSRMRENNPALSQGNLPGKTARVAAPAAEKKAPLVATATPPPAEPIRAAEPELPPLPPQTPVKVGRQHVVMRGDTVTRIAAKYGISKTELSAANGIRNENELREGQELTIPTAKLAKTEPKPEPSRKPSASTYTVRKGDNLVRIASTHGVKYDDLIKLNAIKDPKKIQEGQKLKLPAK
jgi:LysM repeat protein